MNVTVIGGGLAGLSCAALLAKSGHSVTLWEKSKLGGRAQTTERAGSLLNLGPHALYRGGASMRVLTRLGIVPKGRVPSTRKNWAWRGGKLHRLPANLFSMVATTLLSVREKLELLAVLRRIDSGAFDPKTTVAEFVEEHVASAAIADAVRALLRVTTYSHCDTWLTQYAFGQLRLGLRSGVLYLDGGWQSLVDELQTVARAVGVKIEEGHRVTELPSGEVVLAVPPDEVRKLCPQVELKLGPPVRASSLDVVLRKLPRADRLFTLGIDSPTYFSVHSATADLGPLPVLHVARYLESDSQASVDETRASLEAWLDALQPGWREQVEYCRFLPNLTVSHAQPGARAPHLLANGCWVAGDWVGDEGQLADGAFASAEFVADALASTGNYKHEEVLLAKPRAA